ncbi:MAG TPA: TspO/MBR family protein [bacterium]|nr:TspO/MBR family protein [bacterium]
MHSGFFLLLACILACEAVGGLSGLFTQFTRNRWFVGLRKSALQPSGKVLELGWAVCYGLMGAAFYLVLKAPSGHYGHTASFIIFGFLLAVGLLWPLSFFKMKHPFLAFVELLIFWMFALGTIIWFSYAAPAAFFLLLPVMGWILFEAFMSFMLMMLNEGPTAPSHM